MRGPIVVGTDGSEASRYAICEAGALARQTGRCVRLVFVRRPGTSATASVFSVAALGPMEESLDAEQAVTQAQGIAVLDPLGVPWSFEVRCGQPAAELMRSAATHGADTIVVAGRRHGTIGSITHGAVTSQLLHRWPHSLFVVRPPAGPEIGAPARRLSL